MPNPSRPLALGFSHPAKGLSHEVGRDGTIIATGRPLSDGNSSELTLIQVMSSLRKRSTYQLCIYRCGINALSSLGSQLKHPSQWPFPSQPWQPTTHLPDERNRGKGGMDISMASWGRTCTPSLSDPPVRRGPNVESNGQLPIGQDECREGAGSVTSRSDVTKPRLKLLAESSLNCVPQG